MRGLSIRQPWASLVAVGAKQIETRSRRCNYRGPVLIHSSSLFTKDERRIAKAEPFASALFRDQPYLEGMDPTGALPRGQVLAVAELIGCVPTEQIVTQVQHRAAKAIEFVVSQPAGVGMYDHVVCLPDPDRELAFGNYQTGRFGLVLANVQRLENPVGATGQLGLWHPPTDVLLPVLAQVEGYDMPAVRA